MNYKDIIDLESVPEKEHEKLEEFIDEIYKNIEVVSVLSPVISENGEIIEMKTFKLTSSKINEMLEEVKSFSGGKGIYLYKVGSFQLLDVGTIYTIRMAGRN
jgi:hypothetical protein